MIAAMNTSRSTSSAHRFARLIAWTKLMLGWVAMLLCAGAAPRPSRRHIRKRYRFLDLEDLRIRVRNLVIIRAGQIAGRRRVRQLVRRDAPAGFVRRRSLRAFLRRISGAWLCRRLRCKGGPGERIAHLLGVLAELDALAEKLARRWARGLYRFCPLVMTRAWAAPVRSLCASAPAAADSS
jgi:hypothetical protein